MFKKIDRHGNRKARQTRVRRKINGTESKPRLAVYRSAHHIYAQLIDDVNGKTIASASTLDKSLNLESTKNLEAAKAIGKSIAEKAKEHDVEEVVFDRSGYVYHGRISALAEAAREAGLKF
ncbi:BL22 [Aedoeadaptatus ivorii]|uniref:Large ribosomal subunit protein uL18 n=1 Tax=Aedoeadaptatus ivorii TaxID=54006 RepID=A0A448V2H7_9FIRM|nr:50S ribosomal protein L18 [Peptoniphilus ivorii]MDQ0508838.1 large subunit ribosomal protein L18 [Peptoniphilus ivorii]VEJ36042.1 BL22 [Peptoniphilus ivorii]